MSSDTKPFTMLVNKMYLVEAVPIKIELLLLATGHVLGRQRPFSRKSVGYQRFNSYSSSAGHLVTRMTAAKSQVNATYH